MESRSIKTAEDLLKLFNFQLSCEPEELKELVDVNYLTDEVLKTVGERVKSYWNRMNLTDKIQNKQDEKRVNAIVVDKKLSALKKYKNQLQYNIEKFEKENEELLNDLKLMQEDVDKVLIEVKQFK